MPSLLFGDGLP